LLSDHDDRIALRPVARLALMADELTCTKCGADVPPTPPGVEWGQVTAAGGKLGHRSQYTSCAACGQRLGREGDGPWRPMGDD
jgi:hypothetical protein